jgi:hypothetical protein
VIYPGMCGQRRINIIFKAAPMGYVRRSARFIKANGAVTFRSNDPIRRFYSKAYFNVTSR